jgi:hypothetical protein
MLLATALAISAMTYTIEPIVPKHAPSRSRPTRVCQDESRKPSNPKQDELPVKTQPNCKQQQQPQQAQGKRVPK